MYLNSRMPFEAFRAVAAGKYFVDKSEILQEIIPSMGTEERFFRNTGFLRSLLKGQVYVEFAYMTGVLPRIRGQAGMEKLPGTIWYY